MATVDSFIFNTKYPTISATIKLVHGDTDSVVASAEMIRQYVNIYCRYTAALTKLDA